MDGITLHQIMQWHNMGSAVLPPTTMMAQNMVRDGMFHAATLVFVAAADNLELLELSRSNRRTTSCRTRDEA